MFGGFSPKIPVTKSTDSTLLWTPRGLAVNTSNAFSWTATHTFGSTATFNGSSYFSGYVQLNNTTANYSTMYNYANLYNIGTFWQYGSFLTNAIAGSLPYVNDSLYLVYDPDDYFRNNTSRRYGWGIGNGDTLLAKHHVVGAGACSGSPALCNTYLDQTTCNAASGCSWSSYGSCYTLGNEGDCNAQAGCLWGGGSPCSDWNGSGQMTCEYYGCSYAADPHSCNDYTGSGEMACNAVSGCSWYAGAGNTCPSFTNSTDCNNASPCSWISSDCSLLDRTTCGTTMGCTQNFLGDCNTLSDGGSDGTACATQPDCSYDSGSGVCSGMYYTDCSGVYDESCSGDNSIPAECQGTYYTDNCTGTYNNSCQENPLCQGTPTPCSSYTDSSTCSSHSPCVWGQEPAGYWEGDAFLAMATGNKFGVFGSAGVTQRTFSAATASGTYGATEQDMLQKCYDAFISFGFGTA